MVAMPTLRAISRALLGGIIRADPLLRQPLFRFRRGHRDQVVQLHRPAGAGLERLAVGAVHGAVADMLQLGLAGQLRLLRGAEHLLEMAVLAVIHHIQDQIGIIGPHPLDHGGQVGGAVQHAAFRFHQDQRRHRLLVAFFRDTGTTSAPSLISASPRVFKSSSMGAISASTLDSPFHRSNVTPRLANSRVRPTSVTLTKCRHSAR